METYIVRHMEVGEYCGRRWCLVDDVSRKIVVYLTVAWGLTKGEAIVYFLNEGYKNVTSY